MRHHGATPDRAHNPDLPWHFTDLDVLNQTSNFVQVYRNGTTHNAATAGCPAFADVDGTLLPGRERMALESLAGRGRVRALRGTA